MEQEQEAALPPEWGQAEQPVRQPAGPSSPMSRRRQPRGSRATPHDERLQSEAEPLYDYSYRRGYPAQNYPGAEGEPVTSANGGAAALEAETPPPAVEGPMFARERPDGPFPGSEVHGGPGPGVRASAVPAWARPQPQAEPKRRVGRVILLVVLLVLLLKPLLLVLSLVLAAFGLLAAIVVGAIVFLLLLAALLGLGILLLGVALRAMGNPWGGLRHGRW
jgi:hypothetical protein